MGCHPSTAARRVGTALKAPSMASFAGAPTFVHPRAVSLPNADFACFARLLGQTARMSSRRFELDDGTSRKFWEIATEGKANTVRFGRMGTEGQLKTKTHPS